MVNTINIKNIKNINILKILYIDTNKLNSAEMRMLRWTRGKNDQVGPHQK